MKKIYLLLFAICMGFIANAQIPVTVTGNTNTTPNLQATYTSLANALTDLNAVTAMSGPVTFTLSTGSEIAPATGLTIGSATLNPVLSSTNTVTIVKGASQTPVLNAGIGTSTPSSAAPDGVLKLTGADYITIDGLTLTDGNTTNPATMEFGIGLFKLSAGDGCNNNTIQNCIFNLPVVNNASATAPMLDGEVAIEVVNSTATAATTSLTPTNGGTLASNGTNSNNKFYSNTINGGNIGIGFNGYAATVGVGPTPTATTFLGDLNNDIGGTGSASATTGNTILNFGGAPAATVASAGIRANNQWSVNISNNIVNNNNGSGVNHVSTLRGIYGQAGTSANVTISYNTVTVKSGGTTSQMSGIENAIGSTAASNTINMNNNLLTGCAYTTQTSGTIYGIYNSASATNINMNNNTINGGLTLNSTVGSGGLNLIYNSGTGTTISQSNNTIQNLTGLNTTGTIYLTYNSTSTTNANIQNNTFNNISRAATATSGTMYGHYNFGSPSGGTFNFSGNSITNITNTANTGSGTFYGLYNGTSSTVTWNVYNNTVSNITNGSGSTYGIYDNYSATTSVYSNNINNISAGGTVYGLYIGTSILAGNVYSNVVNTITSSGSASTIYGLNASVSTSGSSVNFYKNKIYDVQESGTSGVVYGIYTGGGVILNIYNNLVGDLRATTSSLTAPAPSVAGLYISSGTTVNASFNTFYLNALSSGTNFGTATVYSTSTPTTVNLRNNLFVNNSTASGTGKTVAYQRSSTTITNYTSSSSNNNLFYAGTPSATNVIYFDGTNSDQTLTAYKSRVAPRDVNSISENPNFLSTTGSSSTFLHINPAVATQIESGGIPVTGITDDYDGDVRNVSNPDIGADEFNGIPIDITGPTITYTPLTFTCATTSRTLIATITDPSGVPTSGTGLPVLYWKINNGSYSAATGTYLGSNQYQFTFGSGVVLGDVVSYYIAAQDNASTPNVSVSPSSGASGFSSTPPAASTPPTSPNTYSINGSLSGSYNVGVGGAYTTLTAAINAYNNSCLSGPVTFNLTDATYSASETFPIVINSPYASSTNKLIIKPAVTTTISGSVAGALVKIVGNYVIIDGSISRNRDLTITNTNTTSPSVILISSSGTTPVTNDTIRNTIIINGINTSSAVVISDSASGTAGYFNNISIQNNLIQKAYIGMYINAVATGTNGSGLNISLNDLSTSGANSVRFTGIYTQGVNGATIQGNIIGNFDGTSSEDDNGIWLATGTSNANVSNNKIFNLAYTGTSGYGAHGLYITPSVTNANINIYNNMIYGLSGDGWSYTSIPTDNVIGIAISGTQTGIQVYNNSISLSGNTLNQTSAMSMGIYLGTGSVANIRNNIIVNNLGLLSATGYGSAGIYAVTGNTQFAAIDYNDYYIAPTGSGVKEIGHIASTGYTTISTWRTASGADKGSMNAIVPFVSATDLHIDNTSADSWNVNGRGIAISTVSTDIDGDTRSITVGTPTDIGADEFTTATVPNDATASAAPAVSTTTSYVSAGRKIADITWGAGGTPPTSISFKYYPGVPPPASPFTSINSYSNVAATGGSGFTYSIKYYYTDAEGNGIPDGVMSGQKNDGSWYATGGTQSSDVDGKFVNIPNLNNFSLFSLRAGGALPVRLISFAGVKNNTAVDLKWQVAEQQGIVQYVIERSADGRTFNDIGSVPANMIQSVYGFNDVQPLQGNNFYRLRIIENGRISYSNVVLINFSGKESLVIYPVPAKNQITVQTSKQSLMNTQAVITNIEGKNMLDITLTQSVQTINISSLASGIYFLKTADGTVSRFVKE